MLFNSTAFVQFFAAFLLLHYLCRHHLTARNLLVVGASYLFYGWWDYRFLSLLLITSVLDYAVALAIARTPQPRGRRGWLLLSLVINLGLLGFFKYYDFFAESLVAALRPLGVSASVRSLNIILPVGISFYTFQSMSYAIDVYRGSMPATHNLLNFLAYVSFFPQLVAGPIERGAHLLPQFERANSITTAMLAEGLWLTLWGLFKKVVVADNLAPLVDMVFNQPRVSAPLVLLGSLAFAFQVYGDFSGYSDIARGIGRILGFDIMFNFQRPYFAADLREFWRRWHISLSTWLRDYLYISLGGNRRGPARTCVNLFLTMLLGGLWHGAAWNFVLWGAWHGAGLIVCRWWTQRAAGPRTPLPRWLGWTLTSIFVLYGWLLFRATSLGQIASFTRGLLDWSAPAWTGSYLVNLAVFTAPIVALEIWQEKRKNTLVILGLPLWKQAILQGLLAFAILLFWERTAAPFIYFQF